MTTSISERELVELSAYLDGQLAPGEKARLEKTLRSRPELRAAMADLQHTRHHLRNQPAIRAPRNFTLSPKFAESQQRRSIFSTLFNTMRVASIAASLLFVLVLLGDLFVPRAGVGVPMAAMPVESVPVEEVVEEAAPMEVQESVDEEGVVEVEKEAERLLDVNEATPDIGTALVLPMEEAQAITATEMAYPPPQEMPAAAEPALGESTILETPAKTLPEQGMKPQKVTEGEASPEPDAEEPSVGFWTVWRIFEVGLAIVGLITGVLAILLRITGRA